MPVVKIQVNIGSVNLPAGTPEATNIKVAIIDANGANIGSPQVVSLATNIVTFSSVPFGYESYRGRSVAVDINGDEVGTPVIIPLTVEADVVRTVVSSASQV